MRKEIEIYVIGDTHFHHTNILNYDENKQFKDIEDHDNKIIKIWNNTIREQDKVIHLGDFVFGQNSEKDKNLIKQLTGHKILILGNHDRRNAHWYHSNGFDLVCESLVMDLGGYKILFIHRPPEDMKNFDLIIHGHTHLHNKEDRKYINVGACQLKYRPVKLESIVYKRLQELKKGEEYII